MALTVISTPEYNEAYTSYWLATECPILFGLQRADYTAITQSASGGHLSIQFTAAFTGNVGDQVSVYNHFNDTMSTGLVTNVAGDTIITDIEWVATMDIHYCNNNTVRGGYYFEAQLTINGAVNALTVTASPDTFGYADLDISGVLQTMTTTAKVGDNTDTIMAETNKSGYFIIAFRECWYESDESYTAEGNNWRYAEFVRSTEQGCNLYEYVPQVDPLDATEYHVPFVNQFEKPVFFAGLPFDLSFIADEIPPVSVDYDATILVYNAAGTLLDTLIYMVTDPTNVRLSSLNIDPLAIDPDASYMTVDLVYHT
jgi:hypothetical protein